MCVCVSGVVIRGIVSSYLLRDSVKDKGERKKYERTWIKKVGRVKSYVRRSI